MKKITLTFIFLVLIIIGGYVISKANNKTLEGNNTNVVNNTIEEQKEENIPVWEDDNPIEIGIYKYDKSINKRVLTSEYSDTWKYHTDIVSFNVMYTKEQEISSGKIANVFDSYLKNYENIDNYKIGYIIEFTTENENINAQILSPKDTESFYDYLEIYTYDAIAHRNDKWYSHVTEKEYNEKTLLEGIKLTAGKNVSLITSDIRLTAFTYDEDDFDENNLYRGNCKETVIVKNN